MKIGEISKKNSGVLKKSENWDPTKKIIIPSMKNFRLVQKCVMSQISNLVLTVLEVLDDAATFEASKAKLTRTLENFLKKKTF